MDHDRSERGFRTPGVHGHQDGGCFVAEAGDQKTGQGKGWGGGRKVFPVAATLRPEIM